MAHVVYPALDDGIELGKAYAPSMVVGKPCCKSTGAMHNLARLDPPVVGIDHETQPGYADPGGQYLHA